MMSKNSVIFLSFKNHLNYNNTVTLAKSGKSCFFTIS